MKPQDFAKLWKDEKDSLLSDYTSEGSQTAVGSKIATMGLTPEQLDIMRDIVDGVLTDAFYTLLLGLDGCTAIGGKQIQFKLYDEEVSLLTNCGEIETAAWELFHGASKMSQH